MIDSKEILEENNLEYYFFKEDPILPEKTDIKFLDLISEFEGLEIAKNICIYIKRKLSMN
jgi:hypothetical protein